MARATLSSFRPGLALALLVLSSCQLTDEQIVQLGKLIDRVAPAEAQAPSPAGQPGPIGMPAPASVPQPSVPRDGQLIGTWERTESFGGGGSEYSGALRETLLISGDGSFALGPGEFAGGGGEVSGSSQGGGAQATGYWATSDSVVYVTDGTSAWEPYARYYLESGKLMFTFADGSRQLWYRR